MVFKETNDFRFQTLLHSRRGIIWRLHYIRLLYFPDLESKQREAVSQGTGVPAFRRLPAPVFGTLSVGSAQPAGTRPGWFRAWSSLCAEWTDPAWPLPGIKARALGGLETVTWVIT